MAVWDKQQKVIHAEVHINPMDSFFFMSCEEHSNGMCMLDWEISHLTRTVYKKTAKRLIILVRDITLTGESSEICVSGWLEEVHAIKVTPILSMMYTQLTHSSECSALGILIFTKTKQIIAQAALFMGVRMSLLHIHES